MDVFSESENLMPDAEWDLERLASYTKERFQIAEFFGRKTAVQIWRAGKALLIVKEKLKAERKWTVWAEEHGLPLTSVYEAIKIGERFETEDDITGLTPIEAKMIAGTVKRPKKETKGEKPDNGVSDVNPRDETPLDDGGKPDTKTGTASGDGGKSDTKTAPASGDGDEPGSDPESSTEDGTPVLASDGWFERLREELQEEVAAIEDTVLLVQEWANRQNHPMSSALLRVLIESEQITVLIDEGQEVVRVDDPDLIVALAAAETFLDPIFSRLGITPEIAARHLLDMIREGRGIDPAPTMAKSKIKKSRSK